MFSAMLPVNREDADPVLLMKPTEFEDMRGAWSDGVVEFTAPQDAGKGGFRQLFKRIPPHRRIMAVVGIEMLVFGALISQNWWL